jgi:beta-aspartyl-peptidase (threonine type)
MKALLLLLVLTGLFLFNSCNNSNNTPPNAPTTDSPQKPQREGLYTESFGLVIHGGAGTIRKENMSDSMEAVYKAKMTEAIEAGHQVLATGGTAMEAVTASIVIMEDSPLFNAGKGAVFTHEGANELDASVMEGKDLNAGAVAGVKRVKNPISLAVEVMHNSPHVLLSREGAEAFATTRGIALVEPSYFFTQRPYDALQRILQEEQEELNKTTNKKKTTSMSPYFNHFIDAAKFGTVGCVAKDKNGNIAAGTSTGGMSNKRWHRIGDSPIIGAGTYANNQTCGVSSTGMGEYFIRRMVAYDISAMMEYGGKTVDEASWVAIHQKIQDMDAFGGVIALDKDGNVSMQFNTVGMYRGFMDDKGNLTLGMYKENFPTIKNQ